MKNWIRSAFFSGLLIVILGLLLWQGKPVHNGMFIDYFTKADFELAHMTQAHNLTGYMDSLARDADVVVIGNSRSLLGLREYFVTRMKDSFGLNVMFLSVGFGENISFFTYLLEKYNIRDKIIIINVDKDTFRNRISPSGRFAIKQDKGRAYLWSALFLIKWSLLRAVERITAPENPVFGSPMVLYRSNANGAWIPERLPPSLNTPVGETAKGVVRRYDKIAKHFAALLSKHHLEPICITVPARKVSRNNLKHFAKILNAKFIWEHAPDYTMFDRAHLDGSSASRYVDAIIPKLAKPLKRARKRLAGAKQSNTDS